MPIMSPELLQSHVEEIRSNVAVVQTTLSEIQKSLTLLVRLETEHINTQKSVERAFKCIEAEAQKVEELNKRLVLIEIEIPALKESRKWFLVGLGLVVTLCLSNLVSISNLGIMSQKPVSNSTARP